MMLTKDLNNGGIIGQIDQKIRVVVKGQH